MTDVPGLRYVPRWLDVAAEEELLARIDEAPWSTELRRRVQHYGHRYDYGKRATGGAAEPIPDWAARLAERLRIEGHLARTADQVIVNEYLPGQGISAHIDCVPCFGPAVAAVSLGSAYPMDFLNPTREDAARAGASREDAARAGASPADTSRTDTEREKTGHDDTAGEDGGYERTRDVVAVSLERGSLCVMTGDSRYTWKHRIVARRSDPGPQGRVPRSRRVSVTFRTMAD